MNKIISFEGIDGVGKTSHIRLLSEFLSKNNIPHICTSELSMEEPIASMRRMLIEQAWAPNEELLLIATMRAWHWRYFVEPAVKQNKTVIFDRFIHSTLAYQGSLGVPFEHISYINHTICKCSSPDYVIYISGNPRRSANKTDRIESRDQQFFDDVNKIYVSMIEDNWFEQSTANSFDTVQNNINKFVLRVLTDTTNITCK